ncbi:MAG: hypothetical protein EZS28_046407, partial [Streblomastix strix]
SISEKNESAKQRQQESQNKLEEKEKNKQKAEIDKLRELVANLPEADAKQQILEKQQELDKRLNDLKEKNRVAKEKLTFLQNDKLDKIKASTKEDEDNLEHKRLHFAKKVDELNDEKLTILGKKKTKKDGDETLSERPGNDGDNQQQMLQGNAVEQQQEQAAEDDANGEVRMQMEDQKWEKKLENEISRLQTAFKSMPSPIKMKLIVNIVLSIAAFIAAAITSIILVAVGVSGYSSMAASVLLSGMRPPAIAQIRFFVLRMIADHKEIETPVIEFPDVSSPVFKNSCHTTSNRTQLRDLLLLSSLYFENIHSVLHYGYQPERETNDQLLIGIKTSRLSKSNNVELLLEERNCYSTEDESCETLNPTRIYHVDPPFWGLTTLSARVLLYIEQMRNINLSLITEFSDNI